MNDKAEWFKKRWEALGDVTELLEAASPEYRDPDKYLKELIIDEKNERIAEKRLAMLESMALKDEVDLKQIEVDKVRIERTRMLVETDWTMLSDVHLDTEDRAEYRKYRQYLRDLPELVMLDKLQTGVVDLIEWRSWFESVKYR